MDLTSSFIEYTLDNAIIGDSFRMIQSNNIIRGELKTQSKNLFYNVKDLYKDAKESESILNKNNDLIYSYFMKENSTLKIDSSYSQNFISKFEDNIADEKINGLKNSLFYDKEIHNLSGIEYIQIKDKFYFLNSNKFNKFNDEVISGRYEFDPKPIRNTSVLDMIKTHISEEYNSDFYENSLKFVNDKSIPIYDLDYSALNEIDILKFQDNYVVDSIINYIDFELRKKGILGTVEERIIEEKTGLIVDTVELSGTAEDYSWIAYDSLGDVIEKKLNLSSLIMPTKDEIIKSIEYKTITFFKTIKSLDELRESILYNSKTNKKTIYNYDSIIIEPIVDEYKNYPDMLDIIFDHFFINLSLDSFYRLLIPVGKINNIFNDKTSGYVSSADYEEYTYYVNVDNIKNLTNNINFNYFYLKNLKNPHDEYDYSINDINNKVSCHSEAYSFSGVVLYKILNFMNSSLVEFKNYLDNNHAGVISGQYIKNNDLIPELVKASRIKYNNWTTETLSSSISTEGTWIRYKSFNNYFLDNYHKNLRKEPYLITNNEVRNFWKEKILLFKNDYENEFYEDESLSSYYLDGMKILEEINKSIEKYLTIFDDEEMNEETEDVKIKHDFIKNKSVLSINRYLFSMSDTLESLKNTYIPSLNKILAISILNKNDINDKIKAGNDSLYSETYKERFSSKLNDYKNSFDYYYNHENIMKKDGYIFGYRKYNFINKSFTDKLFMTYNYFTSMDYNFLNRCNLLNDVEIRDKDNSIESYNLNENDFISGKCFESLIGKNAFNINNEKICICTNSRKQNEFLSYIASLMELRRYEFIDFIEGDFKYKEKDISKSNVYSIELKNSNLNYKVLSFNEMFAICELELIKLKNNAQITNYFYNSENETFYENYDKENNVYSNPIKRFLDMIHSLNYKEILDNTINEDVEILKRTSFKIPIESYKFYNTKNELNENIHTKMELRKQLEKSIRKSISRYAPVNTTLWKIKYTGI